MISQNVLNLFFMETKVEMMFNVQVMMCDLSTLVLFFIQNLQ